MRWLVDGYNVIRRAPELKSREQESLEAGRQALCAWLVETARKSDDTFTVVFDGAQAGGRSGGGAVVSNDREVRRAAERAGAVVVTTDQFLARLDQAHVAPPEAFADEKDGEEDEAPSGPRKGNPRRLSKKARATQRALGRLNPGHRSRSRN